LLLRQQNLPQHGHVDEPGNSENARVSWRIQQNRPSGSPAVADADVGFVLFRSDDRLPKTAHRVGVEGRISNRNVQRNLVVSMHVRLISTFTSDYRRAN